jgi:hypothetical protein
MAAAYIIIAIMARVGRIPTQESESAAGVGMPDDYDDDYDDGNSK